jgi:hypothetical protein
LITKAKKAIAQSNQERVTPDSLPKPKRVKIKEESVPEVEEISVG